MISVSWQQAKLLEPSLSALDGFFASPPVRAHALTGGLTNRCWRLVSSDGLEYVWRPTSQICEAFDISRHEEYQVLTAISPLNLGPKVVFVDEQGLLVEWLTGDTPTHSDINIDQILAVAAEIHGYPLTSLTLGTFSYLAKVDHYWYGLNGEFSGTEFEALYRKWRSEPHIDSIPLALCHFDLGSYNLVCGDNEIKVIDWEYAAIADPRLDLALVLQLADVSIEQGVIQYCQARQIEEVTLWLDGVLAWIPRTRMMAMLWYLLAYKLWGDEQYLHSADEFKDLLCMEDHCFENR